MIILTEFGTSDDPRLNNFAGTVTYSVVFKADKEAYMLEFGNVNKGVCEVFLNGKRIGLNWYGKPLFKIEEELIQGNHHLEIKYTTVLSNYVMSLENNTTAQRWTRRYEKISAGLEGELKLWYKK